MEKTNANDFRANLKEWLEAAQKEPIKIIRKTGDAFVLISSEEFEKIQIELASLKGIAKGLTDALKGNTTKSSSKSTKDIISKAKQKILKKNKKAVS